MSTKSARLYKVMLTKAEIKALFFTADQMRDDMDYYDYMGPKRSAKFRDAYGSAIHKLRSKF